MYFGGNHRWVPVNMKETQKPNSSRDLKRKSQLRESTAISNSMADIIPSFLYNP